jgi:uncharacterized phage-associated protein
LVEQYWYDDLLLMIKMPKSTKRCERMKAIDGAKQILLRLNEAGHTDIRKSKVQKLLYFADAWSLALLGRKAFAEPVSAYPRGPVYQDVYRVQKNSPQVLASVHSVERSDSVLLDAIVGFFGSMTPDELTALSHLDGPWAQVWNGEEGKEIPEELIRRAYSSLKAVSSDWVFSVHSSFIDCWAEKILLADKDVVRPPVPRVSDERLAELVAKYAHH